MGRFFWFYLVTALLIEGSLAFGAPAYVEENGVVTEQPSWLDSYSLALSVFFGLDVEGLYWAESSIAESLATAMDKGGDTGFECVCFCENRAKENLCVTKPKNNFACDREYEITATKETDCKVLLDVACEGYSGQTQDTGTMKDCTMRKDKAVIELDTDIAI